MNFIFFLVIVVLCFFGGCINGDVNCHHTFRFNNPGIQNHCIYAQLENETHIQMCDYDAYYQYGFPPYPNSLMGECVKASGCDTDWCNTGCNSTTTEIEVTKKRASTHSVVSSTFAPTETTKPSSIKTKPNSSTLDLASNGINCHHNFRSNYPGVQKYCIYAQLANESHIQMCDYDAYYKFDLPPYPNSPMNECVKAPG